MLKSAIISAGLILALGGITVRACTINTFDGYFVNESTIITEDHHVHRVNRDEENYAHKSVVCKVETATDEIVSFEYHDVISAQYKLAQYGYYDTKTVFSDPVDWDFEDERRDWMCVKAYAGEDVLAEVVIENGIIGGVIEY